MRIQDFCDMKKFEEIMSNWAKSTGLATVAVGDDGKYISECYNFLLTFVLNSQEEAMKDVEDVKSVTAKEKAYIRVMQVLLILVFRLHLMTELYLEA